MRGESWRFVVLDCTEGTEKVPRIVIMSRAVAAKKYRSTDRVPVSGQVYGSRWDNSVVGEVAGFFLDFKLALHAALDAGRRVQARLDEQHLQELVDAKDDEERQQVRDYHSMFRQSHLEVQFRPGEPPVESDLPVVKLAEDRQALIEFLNDLQPAWVRGMRGARARCSRTASWLPFGLFDPA